MHYAVRFWCKQEFSTVVSYYAAFHWARNLVITSFLVGKSIKLSLVGNKQQYYFLLKSVYSVHKGNKRQCRRSLLLAKYMMQHQCYFCEQEPKTRMKQKTILFIKLHKIRKNEN